MFMKIQCSFKKAAHFSSFRLDSDNIELCCVEWEMKIQRTVEKKHQNSQTLSFYSGEFSLYRGQHCDPHRLDILFYFYLFSNRKRARLPDKKVNVNRESNIKLEK